MIARTIYMCIYVYARNKLRINVYMHHSVLFYASMRALMIDLLPRETDAAGAAGSRLCARRGRTK